jgi:hypothetical protein
LKHRLESVSLLFNLRNGSIEHNGVETPCETFG